MPVHLPTPPPVETATIQPAADSTSAAKPIVIEVAEKLFSYKDGTITKINNLLPKPGIDDFYANAADFPKDTYNDLKKAIASTVWYSVTEDGKPVYTNESAIKSFRPIRLKIVILLSLLIILSV